ncbi:MAG: hypothetical protein NZ518_01585, partial [Dehalococcoidia bacterium]|nr:hypothetical protein [Dehalococcoidia bacterium]
MIRDLAAVTLTVPADQISPVAAIYSELFGWEAVFDGAMDRSLAAQWGVDRLPRRVVVLSAGDERRGMLRLVEGPTPYPPPFSTYGWAVPEVSVRGVDALHD